jgi:hypothetical protein
MIIQSARAGSPHLAVMMHEHTALSGQFARAFGNEKFAPIEPAELVTYIISHHDAGWAEFDRDPATDPATNLPYNLVETPAQWITVTSRKSPDFNERHHPYCGLLSSMHSWGLYNGRYGLSKLVLIDRIPPHDRPLADTMLAGELARQARIKAELAKDAETAAWLDEPHLFQNYKQLQFCDTLALYFNRVHTAARLEQAFEHVPLNANEDVTVTIRPRGDGVYVLSPFPFAASGAEFAFAGRMIAPRAHEKHGGWPAALRAAPTRWEHFTLVAE